MAGQQVLYVAEQRHLPQQAQHVLLAVVQGLVQGQDDGFLVAEVVGQIADADARFVGDVLETHVHHAPLVEELASRFENALSSRCTHGEYFARQNTQGPTRCSSRNGQGAAPL